MDENLRIINEKGSTNRLQFTIKKEAWEAKLIDTSWDVVRGRPTDVAGLPLLFTESARPVGRRAWARWPSWFPDTAYAVPRPKY